MTIGALIVDIIVSRNCIFPENYGTFFQKITVYFSRRLRYIFPEDYGTFFQKITVHFSRRLRYIFPGDYGIFFQKITVHFSRRLRYILPEDYGIFSSSEETCFNTIRSILSSIYMNDLINIHSQDNFEDSL